MKHWSVVKKYLVETEKVATSAEKRPSCLYDRWLFNTSQKQTHNAGSGPEFLPVLTCVIVYLTPTLAPVTTLLMYVTPLLLLLHHYWCTAVCYITIALLPHN